METLAKRILVAAYGGYACLLFIVGSLTWCIGFALVGLVWLLSATGNSKESRETTSWVRLLLPLAIVLLGAAVVSAVILNIISEAPPRPQ